MYAPFSKLKITLYRAAGAVIGDNVHMAPRVVIKCEEMTKVKIGGDTTFGLNTRISCRYIEIGRDARIGGDTNILGEGTVKIGDKAYLGEKVILDCRENIVIGDGVQIAPGVKILTHDSSPSASGEDKVVMKPTTLKKKSYIGAGAVILPGVTIGEKAVVGAGAVVTKDVAPDTKVVGSPAKQIKK
jgi:maltose O-acetyltransferase